MKKRLKRVICALFGHHFNHDMIEEKLPGLVKMTTYVWCTKCDLHIQVINNAYYERKLPGAQTNTLYS